MQVSTRNPLQLDTAFSPHQNGKNGLGPHLILTVAHTIYLPNEFKEMCLMRCLSTGTEVFGVYESPMVQVWHLETDFESSSAGAPS